MLRGSLTYCIPTYSQPKTCQTHSWTSMVAVFTRKRDPPRSNSLNGNSFQTSLEMRGWSGMANLRVRSARAHNRAGAPSDSWGSAPSALWVYVAGRGRGGGACSSQATPGAFYLFLIKAASPIQLKTLLTYLNYFVLLLLLLTVIVKHELKMSPILEHHSIIWVHPPTILKPWLPLTEFIISGIGGRRHTMWGSQDFTLAEERKGGILLKALAGLSPWEHSSRSWPLPHVRITTTAWKYRFPGHSGPSKSESSGTKGRCFFKFLRLEAREIT